VHLYPLLVRGDSCLGADPTHAAERVLVAAGEAAGTDVGGDGVDFEAEYAGGLAGSDLCLALLVLGVSGGSWWAGAECVDGCDKGGLDRAVFAGCLFD
jgi:hypothetical protein